MRLLKTAVRRLLWRLDKDLVSKPGILSRNQHANLTVSLRMALSDLYLAKGTMTLVQVGALDGRNSDPLFDFLTRHRVKAVLLEPQPRHFEQLQANYGAYPHVTLVKAALAESEGAKTLFVVTGSRPDDPDWLPGIASFDRTHLLKSERHCPSLKDRITPIQVKTLTPQKVLALAGIHEVDALVVDTEGYDYQVLQLFRAASIRPALIHYERKHLSSADREECLGMLIGDGYRIALLGNDVLAYDPSRASSPAALTHRPLPHLAGDREVPLKASNRPSA